MRRLPAVAAVIAGVALGLVVILREGPAAVPTTAARAVPEARPGAPVPPVPDREPAPSAAPSRSPSAAFETAAATPPTIAAVPRATLTAAGPGELVVGEQRDLVLRLAAASEVGEVGFTVNFDGSVLRVRNGEEGDWAAATASTAQFTTEISSAEDRIQVHSAVASPQRAAGDCAVAVVQFEAIATGVSSVRVSDVMMKDRTGQTVPFVLEPSSLQITAMSRPLPP